ncbi:hypothetical protein ACJJTC_019870 [Scirpophaga incertulas]
MAQTFTTIALMLFSTTLVQAEPVLYPGYGAHLLPVHKSEIVPVTAVENLPLHNYEYHVIPKKEFIITEYENDENSLSEVITNLFNPIMAIKLVASCALSTGVWIVSNMGFIMLGVASVFAFCFFTPYCNIVITSPFSSHVNIPTLDEIECFFRQAYEKYHKK